MTTAQSVKSKEITTGPLAAWLERGVLGALFLFVIAAPNSIAATQMAWFLGLLFWVLRFTVWPRPKLLWTPLDYPPVGVFLRTALTSLLDSSPLSRNCRLGAA